MSCSSISREFQRQHHHHHHHHNLLLSPSPLPPSPPPPPNCQQTTAPHPNMGVTVALFTTDHSHFRSSTSCHPCITGIKGHSNDHRISHIIAVDPMQVENGACFSGWKSTNAAAAATTTIVAAAAAADESSSSPPSSPVHYTVI